MIELPNFAVPGSFSGLFMDAGFTQRGIQSADYIPRKGSRFKGGFTFGPYTPDEGRVMVARLIAAKQGGARVALPLLHSQGSPGSPVTTSATGRTLGLSGLTAGYPILEGYWLSLVKAEQHYLHSVGVGAVASVGGTATIELNELLRTDFANGTVVNLAAPMVEGLLEGEELAWQYGVDRVIPIEFMIEEKA